MDRTPRIAEKTASSAGSSVSRPDDRTSAERMRRIVSARQATMGSLTAVSLVIVLGGAMFPLRSHLSVATTALVLVVPVVVGVAVGGFTAGVIATATGFLVYDFVFIPPYYTLYVGAAQNWTALGVYGVVMIVVARVVSRLNIARSEAQTKAADIRRLFDLSELLVRETAVPELLDTIANAVMHAFQLEGAALFLPAEEGLDLVASAGDPLTRGEIVQLSKSSPVPVSLEAASVRRGDIQAVALEASGQPIGLLALRGLSNRGKDRELLRAFTNHLALALERTQLREHALRAELLEEIDRLRRSLVGAVSHDLRTPLATIKVSTSTLLDSDAPVNSVDARELVGLIDVQADRLDRLVSNLLDMTRIQSGTLELRRQPISVPTLIDESLAVLGGSPELERVSRAVPEDLPPVNVDHVLICQVLANLIDNATRHAPGDTPVTISATKGANGKVRVSVADHGPGIPADERTSIFQMFNRQEAGGRGGLGLAIAQAFVEIHGQSIWVEDAEGGGARFVFTLPIATTPEVS